MTKDTYKPRVPDLMEAIFDVCYLTFDLIAGILFFIFSEGNIDINSLRGRCISFDSPCD